MRLVRLDRVSRRPCRQRNGPWQDYLEPAAQDGRYDCIVEE
jgi:hypothetical protein